MCTPHYTVPVSPQCPQEVSLSTLPPPVLQSTVVSSKRISQHPPGNVVVVEGSLPPRKSPEQLDQLSPASPPLQATELAALSTPEVSLERPSGSVEASAKCVSMGPAHCRRRLQDSVQVSCTSVQQGVFHSEGPRAVSGHGTRSRHSL